MSADAKLSRREFMKLTALGAGALTLVGGCAGPHRPERLFLTSDEVSLLEGIAEQIVPSDEWPGGRDAGVVRFIDEQLAGPYRRYQMDYRKGCAAITGTCMERYGRKFEALGWDQQTSFLREMEAGKLVDGVWKNSFGARFFELLRSHSLQGYYGSPRHGGNKDNAGCRMVGLDEPPIVGQNRYGS